MEKPKVRFIEHREDWNKCNLENCLTIGNERNYKMIYRKEDTLSVSDDYGVVNQIQHLGRSYAGADVSNYKILHPGQIVYTKSPLKAKPYGIVKVNKGDAGIVSVLYAIYNVKEGVLPDYIHFYFDPFFRVNKYLLPLINKGAKNTINISDEIFLKGDITIPKSVSEQQQIASYFKSLDSLIQETTKKISSLKQLKSASLLSMFPQAGETKPRIRFKGFEGEWVEKKLSDISQKVIEKNRNLKYKVTLTNSAEYGIVNQLDFFDHQISNGDNIKGYFVVENDDFVYNPRISVTAPVGPINRNKLGYTGVMSPLYYVFKVYGVDKNYLDYFFKTDIWHKFMKDNGNTGARFDRISISDDTFEKMPIIQPSSLDEQQRIANFFRSLDTQISLETQRLDKLKQIKSACLDKMFV